MDQSYQEEGSVFALPTPSGTPYRTPPRSRSRSLHSHHSGSSSPNVSSSPVRRPQDRDVSSPGGKDAFNSATDETLSPLDPRRFTPSLHASLVSEILSLRREVESKTKDIEHLEANLHTTHDEKETLQETLTTTSKEARSLKWQMQLLEGGTLSAMGELSRERDEAVSDSADVRKRLEQSLKKARSQEESVERTQTLWDRDRSNWEKEKRALETKVHIVEGRLKVVLGEIANSNTVNGQISHPDVVHHQSPKKGHARKGSATSVRSMGPTGRRRDSEISAGTQEGDVNGYRLSAMTVSNLGSTSLADELAFDEEEEEEEEGEDQYEQDGGDESQTSPDELPEERPTSRQSRPVDFKARKILGIDQLPLNVERAQRQSLDPTLKLAKINKMGNLRDVPYIDVGVQYSPPPSPQLPPSPYTTKAIEEDQKSVFYADALSRQSSHTAITLSDISEEPSPPSQPKTLMVSTACQTTTQLPTPPRTPLAVQNPALEALPSGSAIKAETASVATQTDAVIEAEDVKSKAGAASAPVYPIPVIAIHPPASRPHTPTGNVMLPPHTKNASCQADMRAINEYTTSSTQTEDILPDARTNRFRQILLPQRRAQQAVEHTSHKKLPALQPAANPLPNSSKRRLQQTVSSKSALPGRKADELSGEMGRWSPNSDGEEGMGPAAATEGQTWQPEAGASHATTRTLANGETKEAEPKPFDEDDVFRRPTAKFTLIAGRLVSKDIPGCKFEDIFDKIDTATDEPELPPVHNSTAETRSNPPRRGILENAVPPRSLERKPRTLRSVSSKQFDIRKAALISSGTAAHQSSHDAASNGSASASAVDTVKPPPFPVPTRHSSRKLPKSMSEGARSPTPGGRSPRKKDGKSRKPLLRKARSATGMGRAAVDGRQRTPSPPPPSVPYQTSKEPILAPPRIPFGDSMPAPGLAHATNSRRRQAIPQVSHSRDGSGSTTLQPTSVVDAIAQTMVGEWMFKYVRRRKSFGVAEPKAQEWDLIRSGEDLSANITNTGVRHKRWVWLAPYERAVMWSNKQPTSGSALMGKSGRKLEIQSVLDVRDDNPLPKGSGPGPHFNQSILILTPQRALKFTATNKERHYVWLTALSFLSHSPLGLGDLTALPNIPQQEYQPPRQLGSSLRRNPIRDSIRVAKGRDMRGNDAVGQHRSFTTDGVMPPHHSERNPPYQPPLDPHYCDPSDAADPPTVPRHHSHTRHRSNTAPRLPPPQSFRSGFSSTHRGGPPPPLPPPPPSAPYTMTMTTAATTGSDVYTSSLHSGHHGGGGGMYSTRTSSRRGSEASASLANANANHANANANAGYFDPLGPPPTVRMEAFIVEEGGEERMRGSYRTRQGRKKDMGYWGAGERGGGGGAPEDPDTKGPVGHEEFAFDANGHVVGGGNQNHFRGF